LCIRCHWQSAINCNSQISSSTVDSKAVRATFALTQLLHEDVSTTSEQFQNTLSEAVIDDAHVSQELLVNKAFPCYQLMLLELESAVIKTRTKNIL